jgi:putative FmdB family regulatory protein
MEEPLPTYQYACTECDHAFDQFQSFSDDSLTVCPNCQGRLRKVFNAVGVVFKGSGFYRTDSRADKDKAASRAKANGTSETKSDAKANGKTDSTSGASSAKTDGKPSKTSPKAAAKASRSDTSAA